MAVVAGMYVSGGSRERILLLNCWRVNDVQLQPIRTENINFFFYKVTFYSLTHAAKYIYFYFHAKPK